MSNDVYEKFYKCVLIFYDSDNWHYECKLNLWGVTGCDKDEVEEEALHYFRQYLEDGEYDEILGE